MIEEVSKYTCRYKVMIKEVSVSLGVLRLVSQYGYITCRYKVMIEEVSK